MVTPKFLTAQSNLNLSDNHNTGQLPSNAKPRLGWLYPSAGVQAVARLEVDDIHNGDNTKLPWLNWTSLVDKDSV